MKEIGWVSLADRRKIQKLTLVYQAKSGTLPVYLQEIIPPVISTTTNYNLRNNSNFITIPRRTELFSKSFIPSAIDLYNNLEHNITASPSISAFKANLREKFKGPVVPKYFLLGERVYSVMHARIRNHCSNLNFDLYNNHLLNSTRCQCGYPVEDAEHYFFRCNLYTQERISMFRGTRAFHPLSITSLLFGKPLLSDDENIVLFHYVHLFIKHSKRFTD